MYDGLLYYIMFISEHLMSMTSFFSIKVYVKNFNIKEFTQCINLALPNLINCDVLLI